jgi:hypothetical protein
VGRYLLRSIVVVVSSQTINPHVREYLHDFMELVIVDQNRDSFKCLEIQQPGTLSGATVNYVHQNQHSGRIVLTEGGFDKTCRTEDFALPPIILEGPFEVRRDGD